MLYFELDFKDAVFPPATVEYEGALQISKFECEYRATRREEMTKLLYSSGCREVAWKSPDETGFYQPIIVAKK